MASTMQQQLKDDALLASLGYKQEFKRAFKPIELFGLSLSMIGVVPALSSTLLYAIPNGGTVAMVWGVGFFIVGINWAVSCFFLIFVALAMAELGSAMPTSGGLYYWTHRFSTPSCRNLLCWIVGYTNSVAYIAGTASVDYGCAIMILAAASIGSDGTYVPTTAQTYGVFIALLLCHCIIASSATQYLARLANFWIFINIALAIVLFIALPVATPSELKNTASFAFGDFENFYLWPNGFSFILSFLAPTFVVSGFDSAVHVSEEARNAKIAVPWAIISATIVGSIIGWAINVVLAFNMGTDVAGVAGSVFGQPMAQIILNSLGKSGALAVWTFIIIAQFMIGISILTVTSRQMFAFSRDGALPFSGILYHINERTRTPVRCVWAAALGAALLGLIAFAGEVAISAVFTIGVVGQYVADSIPIAARWLGGYKLERGPFHLGIFSLPVAIIAVAWMVFMSVVLLFPTTPQTTAQEMNYAVVVFGGVLFLSLVYYYFPVYGGVHWFTGPVLNVAGYESRDVKPAIDQESASSRSDEK